MTFTCIRRVWRTIWFKDDDDKTPQGKLARGCFYIVYAFFFFLLMFGAVVPTIIPVLTQDQGHDSN